MKIQRLKEAWKNPTTTGIFTLLQSLDVPWKDSNIATALDIEYNYNRSGNKIISPMLSIYTGDTNELTAMQKLDIAVTIYTMYHHKWEKLYALLSVEYNPISNYDMTENETITREVDESTTHTGTQGTTHTGTQTDAHTGTQTDAHTGTQRTITDDTTSGSGSSSTDTGVYGFNSSTAVDDSTSDTTASNSSDYDGDTTRTDNLTDLRTDNLTDLRTDNLTDTRTDNLTDTVDNNESVKRELTRSGNIGVTTSQQMIQSEISLWEWNFYHSVMKDIDSLLTISTY